MKRRARKGKEKAKSSHGDKHKSSEDKRKGKT